jgi:hypothetical protein
MVKRGGRVAGCEGAYLALAARHGWTAQLTQLHFATQDIHAAPAQLAGVPLPLLRRLDVGLALEGDDDGYGGEPPKAVAAPDLLTPIGRALPCLSSLRVATPMRLRWADGPLIAAELASLTSLVRCAARSVARAAPPRVRVPSTAVAGHSLTSRASPLPRRRRWAACRTRAAAGARSCRRWARAAA